MKFRLLILPARAEVAFEVRIFFQFRVAVGGQHLAVGVHVDTGACIYTTSVVGYDGLRHIAADAQGRKDFSPLIRQAQALGGYQTDQSMSGVNGGHMLTTGFAHAAVLDKAPQIIEAIRSGAGISANSFC